MHFKAVRRVKNQSVFCNLKKKWKKKEKRKKRKEQPKISTRFVISTNNLIMYVSGYLKDDPNLLTYSITWDGKTTTTKTIKKKNEQKKQAK